NQNITLRGILIVTTLLVLVADFQVAFNLKTANIPFSLASNWWKSVIIMGSFSVVICMIIFRAGRNKLLSSGFQFLQRYGHKYNLLVWVSLIIVLFGYYAVILWLQNAFLQGYIIRITVLFLVSVIVMLLAKMLKPSQSWALLMVGSFLSVAAWYKSIIFLSAISASPFSLGWSEGSRYYYASLLFSEKIYHQPVPLSTWHASRYMLLAIPFFVRSLPIWVHRSWQVFLWLSLSSLGGFLLAKRIKLRDSYEIGVFSVWTFLFLLQGPVYYHLLLSVILILWGTDFKKPKQTFIIVILASIWAGLSRVNWIPVPVFLVSTLYFFEVPGHKIWQYLQKPMAWGLSGVLAALGAYFAYIPVSGNTASKFGSSFTSD
ncbi:MAG: hypothetical protein R8K21_04875, partial [Mariprofundales bacterium]